MAKVTTVLQKYPHVLNGDDYNMTFFYPGHFGRLTLYQGSSPWASVAR